MSVRDDILSAYQQFLKTTYDNIPELGPGITTIGDFLTSSRFPAVAAAGGAAQYLDTLLQATDAAIALYKKDDQALAYRALTACLGVILSPAYLVQGPERLISKAADKLRDDVMNSIARSWEDSYTAVRLLETHYGDRKGTPAGALYFTG